MPLVGIEIRMEWDRRSEVGDLAKREEGKRKDGRRKREEE
tara:strand:+ start:431 stop:550 length:120 start_codon:yes stop_codon:yes gene_type:complete